MPGSMRWAERNGTEYLLRKRGKVERSLGQRSPETEMIYRQFMEGRGRNESEMKSLAATMEQRAPVRPMGLGRVPKLTARILRLAMLVSWERICTSSAPMPCSLMKRDRALSSRPISSAMGDADLLMGCPPQTSPDGR